jgi:hypothetical protein
MAGTRKADIDLERIAGTLADSGAASDGTANAEEPRSAKKKRAAKKTVKKKATKKAKKKATKKTAKKAGRKKQAKAAPKKRARARKAKPDDAPVAPAPEEPVELSPAEALALLMQMSSDGRGAGSEAAPADDAAPEAAPDDTADTAPEGASEADDASGDASGNASDDAPVDEDASSITDVPIAEIVCDTSEPEPEPVEAEDPGLLASILGASCRVLTFEGEGVHEEMRVARAAVEHLQRMVMQCGLGVSIGPICLTPGEFLTEWDNTPASMPVAIVANLSCAGAFLPAVVDERPRVASAYWIVFETLRSQLSTATSEFLSELRSRHRLRAIGFGPRNMATAARDGAEAVRGHVEWGFGRGPVSVAG